MSSNTPQKVKMSTFFKMLMAKSEISPKDIAEKIETTTNNVHLILSRGRTSLNSLIKIMEVCGEPLIIKLKDGQLIELELNEKKSKENVG